MSNTSSFERRDLLQRWKEIQDELDGDDDSDPSRQRRILQLKEEWFSDSFNILINRPEDIHLWCNYSDLMGPLLETFHDYFKEKHYESPQNIVWRRISRELGQCTQCICCHHQALESYGLEYESETVDPLLKVLQLLDGERVTEHLKEINSRILDGQYDPECHSAEVVSLIFEVLMFPIFLDDKYLVNQFQIFVEAIDSSHELTLAGRYQYPGVYAMLFLRSGRARAIGLRLANCLGKLRKAADLEPLQPLLRKYITILETDVLPSTSDASRPRVQLERTNIWLGIKTLLGFLEPPAFEEGILERHPVLLSIILNHVSDDTSEFSYAVTCLRATFEMLGCKLWLRTSISPSMMRNTLLGQCFHTQNEKSHKEIFDLFLPFLQSLEALQDGEHEKQRRNVLYFLLRQVTNSRNFSLLTRKNACKIAILIVLRGYKMYPPCPPYECAHIWAPSLLCSLKDSSLHSSLRQPAFDLVDTIIVSDASAMISLTLKHLGVSCIASNTSNDFFDAEDESFPFEIEKVDSCWDLFSIQSKLASRECKEWICVPMLWFSVMVDVDPSNLPISFSKAVFWALSHVSIIQPDLCIDHSLALPDWLSSYADEISSSFGWEVPHGSDDGGDGKNFRNSVRLSSSLDPLSKAFKRFAVEFIYKMDKGDLLKQWAWETGMAECLILLLIDPNESIRKVGRTVIEHISKTQGLTSGLQFLCSGASSMSALYAGVRFALSKVQADSSKTNFHNLQNLFFIIFKLLKEVVSPQKSSNSHAEDSKYMKYSSDGGFLRQPCIDHFPVMPGNSPNAVDTRTWEKFSCELSLFIWPFMLKCIKEGKALVQSSNCQMACIRLLEAFPCILERLMLSTNSGSLVSKVPDVLDCKWICDLVDWGKSTLVVISRHWKQCMRSVLNCFRLSENSGLLNQLTVIEEILNNDTLSIDELKEKVSCISISLPKDIICPLTSNVASKTRSFHDEDPQLMQKLHGDKLVFISDDDDDDEKLSSLVSLSSNSSNNVSVSNHRPPSAAPSKKYSEPFPSKIFAAERESSGRQKSCDVESATSPQGTAYFNRKFADSGNGMSNSCTSFDLSRSQKKAESDSGPLGLLHSDQLSKKISSVAPKTKLDLVKEAVVTKDLICDVADDPLERDLDCIRPHHLPAITGPGAIVPKRKVIQLQMPHGSKSGVFGRADIKNRRFNPPRMDDWYRPILELDFSASVGLSSSIGKKIDMPCNLKKVPLCFESSSQYFDIFRPLVLEEFKAQLQSSYAETSLEDMYCGGISIISVERIDDFHLIRCRLEANEHPASKGCSENDLVIITKEQSQSSVNHMHALGKVERHEKCNKSHSLILTIRFHFPNSSSRLNKIRSLLIERSKWSLSRIMSLTPQIREFHALSSLNDIPMLPVILNPIGHSRKHSESRKSGLEKLPLPLHAMLKSLYNDSQLDAINISIGKQESQIFDLSLIQGPPGTGKTRTIVAIVSALLALKKSVRVSSANASSNSSLMTKAACSYPNTQISQSAAIARAWQDAAFFKQLITDSGKDFHAPVERSGRGRVLICAQSNAAVDELVARISHGLFGDDGKEYKPYLVRVGNSKTIHPNSLPYFIDTLVEQRLSDGTAEQSFRKMDPNAESSVSLRAKLEKVVDSIRFLESKRAKLDDCDTSSKVQVDSLSCKGAAAARDMSEAEVSAKLNILYEQKRVICRELAAAQLREKKVYEESRSIKNKIRKSILQEAEIVVTTLSGCGGDLYGVCSNSPSVYKHGNYSEQTLFDVAVIDEAAQALEPATLIPLQLLKSSGIKCIMVGDPKQLPATVLSNVASKFLYECSMFERLQRAGHPVIMLTEQYRMHPDIRKFPSFHFYENKLLDGSQILSKFASFHEMACLGPYMFFDITDGCEQHGKNAASVSLRNESEVEAAVQILTFMKKRYPSEFFSRKIGVITPYRSQLSLLRASFSKAFGPSVVSDMEFNTVDGFQGREVDIVVFSTVRASEANDKRSKMSSDGIGFVADVRRMNVALTRAKISLWIVGNARTLQRNIHWDALIQNAKERKLLTAAVKPYKSIFEKCQSSREISSLPSLSSRSSCQKESKLQAASSVVEHTTSSTKATNKSKVKALEALPDKPIEKNDHDIVSTTLKGKNFSKGVFPIVGLFHDEFSKGDEIPSGLPMKKSGDGKISSKQSDISNVKDHRSNNLHKEPIENISSSGTSPNRKNKALIKNAKGPRQFCEKLASEGTISSQAGRMFEHSERESEQNTNSNISDAKAKHLSSARKQQRADIDALLSSALIPSKKPVSSSNLAPVGKLSQNVNARRCGKPSKFSKGPSS